MPAPLFTSNPADFLKLEGLYIQETNPPGFVRGVDLNTVGVFGPCVRGPIDEPILITSETRFLEVFGGRDYGAGGTLIGKVWQSMLNKPFGTTYVVRAALSTDVVASFTEEDTDGGGGTAIIRIDASSAGAWGNNVKFRIEDATDANALHFNLRISYLGEETLYEDLNTQATFDNLATVIGDDDGNDVLVTKLADGRPLNTDDNTAPYLTALDTGAVGGFMALGTTVASYTSVLGTTGALVDADYTGASRAIDAIADFKGVNILYAAEDTEARVTAINTALVTKAAAWSDRMACIWSGDHTELPAAAITYFDTLTDSDRIINCFNSPWTLDPETGVNIQVPPVEWMASILSQTDVDIHPGEEATKKFTAGIAKLTQPAIARADYILLRAAGVAALESDQGFSFVSGVVSDLTTGKTEITRRRSADFLQLSLADRLKFFVKKKNLASRRRIMGGEVISFSQTLQNQERIIESFAVDQESVNTEAQRAQGLEFILYRVKLIGHILHLVLKTEIGTGTVIEA